MVTSRGSSGWSLHEDLLVGQLHEDLLVGQLPEDLLVGQIHEDVQVGQIQEDLGLWSYLVGILILVLLSV